jgi:hypothetical protein
MLFLDVRDHLGPVAFRGHVEPVPGRDCSVGHVDPRWIEIGQREHRPFLREALRRGLGRCHPPHR